MPIDHQDIQEAYRDKMRILAQSLDRLLNDDLEHRELGFALLIFPFGDPPNGRINYISNARREEMVIAVREWVEKAEQYQLELERGEGQESNGDLHR